MNMNELTMEDTAMAGTAEEQSLPLPVLLRWSGRASDGVLLLPDEEAPRRPRRRPPPSSWAAAMDDDGPRNNNEQALENAARISLLLSRSFVGLLPAPQAGGGTAMAIVVPPALRRVGLDDCSARLEPNNSQINSNYNGGGGGGGDPGEDPMLRMQVWTLLGVDICPPLTNGGGEGLLAPCSPQDYSPVQVLGRLLHSVFSLGAGGAFGAMFSNQLLGEWKKVMTRI